MKSLTQPQPTPPLEVIERELPGGGMLLHLATSTTHKCDPPRHKAVKKFGMQKGSIWQCECGRTWWLVWKHEFWSLAGGFLCWMSGTDYCRLDNSYDLHKYN